MVIMFDGDSEHVAHAWTKIGLAGKKSDLWLFSILSNALHRSNSPKLLLTYAPIPELPSKI